MSIWQQQHQCWVLIGDPVVLQMTLPGGILFILSKSQQYASLPVVVTRQLCSIKEDTGFASASGIPKAQTCYPF